MSDATLDGTYVAICDWHGRVIWVSSDKVLVQPGDDAWGHIAERQKEQCKIAFSRVATLREQQVLDCDNQNGDHFRAWLWPLQSPEMAVCILAVAMPRELQSLSKRERQTLGLLAQGHDTKEIAEELGVSLSTVHTHLRRSREKTGSRNLESLAAFAARYCHPGQDAPRPNAR